MGTIVLVEEMVSWTHLKSPQVVIAFLVITPISGLPAKIFPIMLKYSSTPLETPLAFKVNEYWFYL